MERTVNSKAENYRLYQAGEFGNKLQSWDTLEGLLDSGFTGLVSMRYKTPGSPFLRYDANPADVPALIDAAIHQGAERSLFTFNESAPDDAIVLQGELINYVGGLHFNCSWVKRKMRDALAESAEEISGLRLTLLLRHLMSPNSFANLEWLLEQFPSSVIELSIYSRFLGCLPRQNALFWEVRTTY